MAGPDLKSLLDIAAPAAARERAYAELLRLVTIFVKARMGDKLRTHRDSIDVCQSIAKSFVEDASRGRLSFENQAAFHGYLQQVVRSKLAELARYDSADKRGGGAVIVGVDADEGSAGSGGSGLGAGGGARGGDGVGGEVIGREEVALITEQLGPEDIEIAAMRGRGMEWSVIAATVGKSEASLRQRWSRIQKRLTEGR